MPLLQVMAMNTGTVSSTRAAVGVGLVAVLAGCATMTPEGRRAFQVYWDAARRCEEQYRNLHVDRVQSNGDVLLTADHDIRRNVDNFTQCYHDALSIAVTRLREHGDVFADAINAMPAVDMD